MRQLFLVRYGQYKNGHLTEEGRSTMRVAAERIQTAGNISVGTVAVIAARVPRAEESARVIAEALDVIYVNSFPELYAAEEDGVEVRPEQAKVLLESFGATFENVIVVLSREYIESLPQLFGVLPIQLDRGEVYAIDLEGGYGRKLLTNIVK